MQNKIVFDIIFHNDTPYRHSSNGDDYADKCRIYQSLVRNLTKIQRPGILRTIISVVLIDHHGPFPGIPNFDQEN